MISLGVNIGHDRGASLVRDGEVVCAISLERLDRIKHSSGVTLPYQAMEYCLEVGNIAYRDLDIIVFNYSHHFKAYTVKDKVKQELLALCPRVEFVPHHLAHAYATFYASPFKDAMVLICDGAGNAHKGNALEFWKKNEKNFHKTSRDIEGESGYYFYDNKYDTIYKRWQTRDGKFQKLSLGRMYWEACLRVGMGILDGGKLMGLAPYGEKLIEPENIITKFRTGFDFEIDINKIKKMPNKSFEDKAKIAWVTQYNLEEILIWLVTILYRRCLSKNICVAGGVGLNSVSNDRIIKETKFEKIFILPASNDSGIALGCAYFGYYNILKGTERKSYPAYTGKQYSKGEIKKALEGLKYRESNNLYNEVSELMTKGKIIGWFQDKSEYGPRALGNRSILCDPRKGEMKDKLNDKVKHRESFRPFAPAVLYEEAHTIFDINEECPYMLRIVNVLPEAKSKVKAITHVDGTARVQTITKRQNEKYYNLIEAFFEKTGVPVLLNTSFNIAGEPVVETPQDAVKCFLGTEIDYLVIGNYIVEEKNEK